MRIELPEIRPEEHTPLVDSLLAVVGQLLDRVRQLEETNQQLRDEVARFEGGEQPPHDLDVGLGHGSQALAARPGLTAP